MSRQKISASAEQNRRALRIYASDPALSRQAATLAGHTGLRTTTSMPKSESFLHLTSQGLSFCPLSEREKMKELRVDFTTSAWSRRLKKVRKEQLIQAMGRNDPEKTTVIDATAGLGRDSFLLAAAGFTLKSFERNSILAALLFDGLKRTAGYADTRAGIRIILHCADARKYLQTKKSVADIIYLDPMFPPRKNSTKVKKELQIIQQIVGNDANYEELFSLALQNADKRVVVKRPKRGPWITSMHPSYSVQGKTIRFDIYLTGSADY